MIQDDGRVNRIIHHRQMLRFMPILAAAAAFFATIGCVNPSGSGPGFAVEIAWEGRVPALSLALSELSGPAGVVEAERMARLALATAERLRRDWRPVGPPLFNNLLVNMGYRERGLCYQWTNDLLEPLEERVWRSFDLHWGTSRWGDKAREHNAVVITARGRPFSEGLVLDAWRHGGRLIWLPVRDDDKYRWRPLTASELEQHRPVARASATRGF